MVGLLPFVSLSGLKKGAVGISLVAADTSTGSTITINASAQAGDVAFVFEGASSSPTITIPSGWTQIDTSDTTSSAYGVWYYKILSSGDVGTAIGAMDGNSYNSKHCIIVRLSSGVASSVSIQDFEKYSDQNDPPEQTINSSSGSAPLVAFGHAAGNGTRTFSSTSSGMTVQAAGATETAYQLYGSSPADRVVGMDDGGFNNKLVSFYAEIS